MSRYRFIYVQIQVQNDMSRYRFRYVQVQVQICPDTGLDMSRYRFIFIRIQVQICPNTGLDMSRYRFINVRLQVQICRITGLNMFASRFRYLRIQVSIYPWSLRPVVERGYRTEESPGPRIQLSSEYHQGRFRYLGTPGNTEINNCNLNNNLTR